MARGISGQQVAAFLLGASILCAQAKLTPQRQSIVRNVRPDTLRAHVAFLSSDLLEGRGTPSRGLDVAAEYIAAQFRLAGLEPAGDDGYFQTVNLEDLGRRGLQLINLAGPDAPRKVRNVAGILRGRDPRLRETYVMLTSHYDHQPPARSGEDRIFNGANDDASGTSSVLQAAAALAAMPLRPQRSVLFIAFFGEERGLLGSTYYGQHPLVPPAKTIAHLNLEQIGRTDAGDGPQIKTASITGFDFSELPARFVAMGKLLGVNVYKNPEASDQFFSRSDNQTMANLGVPAHTLCVAFDFPDYHKVTDTWEKLDYDNMAAINRLIAFGILQLASAAPPPQWNAAYPAAQKYVEAAKKLK